MLRRAVIAAAACTALASAFYVVRQRQGTGQITQIRRSPLAAASADDARTADLARIEELQQQKDQLQSQLSNVKSKLADASTEQETLSEKLADADSKVARLMSSGQSEEARATQDSEAAKNQMNFLQNEVERLRFALDDSKANLNAEQSRSADLRAKLDQTNSDLLREQNLRDAKNQIGDLVAARNLHIVDVYDTDSEGKRQQAFGRVFYTEGKSLVFYAYDLQDSRHLNANIVFHVWGEKAGVKETTHSLGLLHNEDATQGRWALTFDDPKVLAQINSVYVTAESDGKHSDEPRGRKVLYAYFGSEANHP
jgi:predicted  nucleic acid-binding Zn-ribbon protein